MKTVKNILGAAWAVWGLVTFTATLIVVVIPVGFTFLLEERKGVTAFWRITQIWMRVWLFLIGSPLKVVGRQYFEKGKNYVVVSNHNSLMDVPVTTPFVPGPNKTIAKKSFAKTPLFGWIYIRGSVLVDRESEESRRKSFEDMKEVLKKGLHMVVYPEGTRNRTIDPLKKFHDGAFKLAITTGKDIIPTVLFNTRKILPANKTFYFWPSKIEMHFLPPVSHEGLTSRELKEKVFAVMWEYYLAHHKEAGS